MNSIRALTGRRPDRPRAMKTLHLNAEELGLSFEQSLKLANAAAEHLLEAQGGAMLLIWTPPVCQGRYGCVGTDRLQFYIRPVVQVETCWP
jgi:hypothetical protein